MVEEREDLVARTPEKFAEKDVELTEVLKEPLRECQDVRQLHGARVGKFIADSSKLHRKFIVSCSHVAGERG